MNCLELLIPGLRKLSAQRGCEFKFNGFIPAIFLNEHYKDLSVVFLDEKFKHNEYDKITDYVNEICDELFGFTKQDAWQDSFSIMI